MLERLIERGSLEREMPIGGESRDVDFDAGSSALREMDVLNVRHDDSDVAVILW